ncbi:MAG TPA: KaiC domain-containing protein [Methanoregulaceae archaeon]|nr:KaiC domain-containing protein [Methanoregulaceae archaeon]
MNGERVKIGIEGLDTMLGGGLIPGSITAIIGSYGTGKTTFALQFLWQGVCRGEHVIYISLEEREERIKEYMAQKDWNYHQYINKSLTVLRLDPSEFNIAISRIKNELPDLVRKLGATRVVIDPISLFEDLFEDSALRRQEMFRLVESLRDQQCTVVMTSETDSGNQYISRHNLIEYLCDTVILLNYVRPADLTGVHLAVEVVKMRLSQHSREIKPYEIQKDRILVYSEANVF